MSREGECLSVGVDDAITIVPAILVMLQKPADDATITRDIAR